MTPNARFSLSRVTFPKELTCSMRYSLLSFFLGALLTLAFSPFDHWLLAFVSLSGLSWLWLNPHEHHPIRYGFLFGLGNFSTGVHWVYISMYAYGGAPLFFAVGANILLILYLSLFPLLIGLLLHYLSRPATVRRALLIPLFWITGEIIRSYLFSGFPWLSVGYTQLYGLFKGIIPLAGMFAAGFILMLICSLLAFSYYRSGFAAIFAASLIGVMSFSTQFLSFTTPIGNPISVALIQGNVAQLTKFEPEQMLRDMQDYIQLIDERREQVVILPETAFAFMEELIHDDYLNALDKQYREKNQAIILGMPTGNYEKGEYYNSVITLGSAHGRYHKKHLLPFGEYLPMRRLFSFFRHFVTIPMGDFSRGESVQPLLSTNGVSAGVFICFEGAFGRVVQPYSYAQYLINVSNDGWFQDSIAADQHLQLTQVRALELGREIARATNNGHTVFIRSDGSIAERLPRFQRAVLSHTIQPRTGQTPYAKYGEKPLIYGLLLYAMMCALIFLIEKEQVKSHARYLSTRAN